MTQFERNRKAVQQGLDRRAAQRAEAAQDAADRCVYEEINRQGRENRAAIERIQEAEMRGIEKARADKLRDQHRAEQEAMDCKRLYSLMLSTYGSLAVAAIVTFLYTKGGVQSWVVFPVIALTAIYIIANFAAHIIKGRGKNKKER